MTSAELWMAGARPRTLPAAVVPVAVGAAHATRVEGDERWWCAGLALVVSLALQVGVNYANDYQDGVRGTDAERVGPMRLVGSGSASPRAVKTAALASFGVAAVAGLAITLVTTPWLILVGLAAIAAAWFYTGGPRPYGYAGLGEPFVFVFFGLVATMGTTFAVATTIDPWSIASSSAVGLLACALLVVNNLRDIPGDTEAGKRTLAVRIGDEATRRTYVAMLVAAAAAVAVTGIDAPWVALVLVAVPLAIPPVRRVLGGARGRDLVPVLAATGRVQLVGGLALAVGLLV